MSELLAVPFYEDVLQATQDEQGVIWAGVRSMCDGLGLKFTGQLQRLKRLAAGGAAWPRPPCASCTQSLVQEKFEYCPWIRCRCG